MLIKTFNTLPVVGYTVVTSNAVNVLAASEDNVITIKKGGNYVLNALVSVQKNNSTSMSLRAFEYQAAKMEAINEKKRQKKYKPLTDSLEEIKDSGNMVHVDTVSYDMYTRKDGDDFSDFEADYDLQLAIAQLQKLAPQVNYQYGVSLGKLLQCAGKENAKSIAKLQEIALNVAEFKELLETILTSKSNILANIATLV